jgi:hypothetical protein
MPTFVVETYLSRADPDGLDRVAAAIRSALERPDADRGLIRYLRSVYVPVDETCLHFLVAPSKEAVAEVGRLAALSVDRILETHDADGEPGA